MTHDPIPTKSVDKKRTPAIWFQITNNKEPRDLNHQLKLGAELTRQKCPFADAGGPDHEDPGPVLE